MAKKNRTDNKDRSAQSAGAGTFIGKTGRERKIMNAVVNTNIILVGTLMGGITEAMMNATRTVASGMAGAVGGEEAGKKVSREFKQRLPEVDGKMKAMIADVRKDLYVQIEQKKKEIKPFLSDPVFDIGPKRIEEHDFKLPKLTEELDDRTLAQYTRLVVSENPSFTKMFRELTNWMNTLPKFTEKSNNK